MEMVSYYFHFLWSQDGFLRWIAVIMYIIACI